MEEPTTSPETVAAPPSGLADLAEQINQGLEDAVNDSTNQAFNLGCLIGILPAAIFALVTFLVTGFSPIGAFMAIVLGVIGAVAFANLSAMITRRNTVARKYREEFGAQIERSLSETGNTREQFDQAARQTLSPSSALYAFIQPPPAPEPEDEIED